MTDPADRHGFLVPADWSGPVDVEFDGIRVLSFDASRSPGTDEGGDRRSEWPASLRPHLTGRTEVTFRDHATGAELGRTEVAFDSSPGRTTVVDDDGRPLAMTKWGRLTRTFSDGSDLGTRTLDDLDRYFAVCAELGVDSCLGYGTLLGAVRTGRFIGHDNDADVLLVSHGTSPAAAAADSHRLQRELRRRGWGVRRQSAGFLNIWAPGRTYDDCFDVFTAYCVDGWVLVDRWVRGPGGPETLVPFGTISLEGRTYPAPADPETVLALTYGPQWRVPDPSFRYRTPRSTLDRSRTWMGIRQWGPGTRAWDDEPPVPASSPEEPTAFAVWCTDRLRPDDHVLEMGCRSGVDGVHLAGRCGSLLGYDQLLDHVAYARARAADVGAPAEFVPASFRDRRHLVSLGADLARRARDSGGRVAYCRRLLERLDPAARDAVWMQTRTALRRGGRMFLDVPADDTSIVEEAVAHGGKILVSVEQDAGRRWLELAW
ncbi:hypothetical protein EKO23_03925 [Nocardioides guangzhouensis]|uniref:LicD/FKTN/FKRP nucleotidyltransferase domain-containing protein n=1 Tax=Nocardioides guangzhouensis TaxID=2497878 RepID=A0A4Q4ZJ84_9ACTN|nr:class I SAM-dependent methyltransferase [Nocardioides guangzhouensis]RYP88008.1 hypothetical protein EKO23_03925 [Nocardioides guangzhouensis]